MAKPRRPKKLSKSHRQSISIGMEAYWAKAGRHRRRVENKETAGISDTLRSVKTKIARALPHPVRGVIAGLQLYGKAKRAEKDGFNSTAERMKAKAKSWATGAFPRTDPKGQWSGMHSTRKPVSQSVVTHTAPKTNQGKHEVVPFPVGGNQEKRYGAKHGAVHHLETKPQKIQRFARALSTPGSRGLKDK